MDTALQAVTGETCAAPARLLEPMGQPTPMMLVGVITYNPDVGRLRELCLELSGDGIEILLIDNQSDNVQDICDEFDRDSDIRVVRNPENIGLAAAVNQLVEFARGARARYIMPVDQDSKFDACYATNMLGNFHELQADLPLLAAMGAKVFDVRKRAYQRFMRFGHTRVERRTFSGGLPNRYVDTDFLITSGTVVSLDCVDQIGPMREDLFIDSVDLEWSFRAVDRGWRLVGCEEVHMYQEVGVDSIRVPLLNTYVRVHNPLRYYYMTRNRLFLYRQPHVRFTWMLKDFPRAVLKFMFLSVASPMRKQIIKEHARGVLDSFKL